MQPRARRHNSIPQQSTPPPVAADIPHDVTCELNNVADGPHMASSSQQNFPEASLDDSSRLSDRVEQRSVSLRSAALRQNGAVPAAWAAESSTSAPTQRGHAVPGREGGGAGVARAGVKGGKQAAEGGGDRLEFELQEDLCVWGEDVADKAGTAAATAARAHIHAALVDGDSESAPDGESKEKGKAGKKKRGSRRWSDGGGCSRRTGRGGRRGRFPQSGTDTEKHGFGEEEGRDCSSDGQGSPGAIWLPFGRIFTTHRSEFHHGHPPISLISAWEELRRDVRSLVQERLDHKAKLHHLPTSGPQKARKCD